MNATQHLHKIIHTRISGSEYLDCIPGPKGYTLEALQAAVGGLIELVYITNGLVMVVNEEGLVHGLPFNFTASLIAGYQIVGNVVICKSEDIN